MIQDLAPQRAAPTAEETRRALAEVLTDPGLRKALSPGENSSLRALADAWQRLRRWFDDLLQRLLDLHDSSPGLYWLIFLALVAVAIGLLTHIGWSLAQAMRAPARASVTPPAVDATRRAHSQALRARAHALAAEGDSRGGVRHLLLALLALVEERRLLAVAQSWTIREVLGRLARQAPALFARGGEERADHSASLRTLAVRIEGACYGDGAVAAQDFESVDRWLDDLLRVEANTKVA